MSAGQFDRVVPDEAVAAWAAAPRTARGGQPSYSPLAIGMALTLRAVFRLAYRQAEGLIASIISLLGLALCVPDHTTLSRRSASLTGPAAAARQRRRRRRCATLVFAGGQHGSEVVRCGRMAGRETWHQDTPSVAEAAPRCGCRHRADRGRR
jgi:hypothetical protein